MKIVINEIPPSNNQYMGKTYNYHQYQREKERWHWLVKCAIKEKPKKPFEKAIVNIKYYFKDKRSRDPDNYSGKMLLDPLVREGILIDDSFKVVTLVLAADCDKNNPRTEIEIEGAEKMEIIKILERLFKKEQMWWEEEAEENGMSVEHYLNKMKLEKEYAEAELLLLKRKEDARSRREKWDDYQAEQFEKEKEKVAGYEQAAQVNSAYISILLKRLGATEDNPIDIQATEVTEALTKYEARAVATENGFGLYYSGCIDKVKEE